MSRISKEIAHATAVSLLATKKAKINQMEEKLSEMTTEAIKKTIPKEVLELYGMYPKYFNVHSRTRLNCAGFGYDYYNFKTLPDNGENPSIDPKEGNKILALTNKVNDAKKKYKDLLNEIEVALFAFRTYANVEKEFPEAFALLPTKVSQAVMVNINSIRKSIAS